LTSEGDASDPIPIWTGTESAALCKTSKWELITSKAVSQSLWPRMTQERCSQDPIR
jgi:hypothetical protein